ncbi:MAG: outer-membrane lipoprotein carrier protein LolA [Bacteroidetes bacterium]|nr:outer-membrane lipoprotein carrier protein LolA [Bacteroidota bacterium]
MRNFFKVLAILMIINISVLYSQTPDKDECFKHLIEKYGKMNSVSFKFTSPESKNFQGSLIAMKGGKYVIDTKDRVVYCNGETVWNNSISDNKVIINSYDNTYSNPMSIEKFFFNFLEQYAPTELTESTSSSGTKSYVLQLTPKSEKSFNIDDLKIWIDPKNYIIRSIKLKIGGKIQTLIIDDLVIDKKYSDKTFVFVPTGKEQVIDFR